MSRRSQTDLSPAAERLLARLAASRSESEIANLVTRHPRLIATLTTAALVTVGTHNRIRISVAGKAYLARTIVVSGDDDNLFRAQQLDLGKERIATPEGPVDVLVDGGESPLTWLARRRGRDGRPLIEPMQLQAGERLRNQFTRAQLMPRVTTSWSVPTNNGGRAINGGQSAAFTEATLAARQRVRHALNAVGPEFAGLLLDVCCFLKRLEDVESERGWPARSAKVVLQLALDRLARHYGLATEARGHGYAPLRTWLAPDATFLADDR